MSAVFEQSVSGKGGYRATYIRTKNGETRQSAALFLPVYTFQNACQAIDIQLEQMSDADPDARFELVSITYTADENRDYSNIGICIWNWETEEEFVARIKKEQLQ